MISCSTHLTSQSEAFRLPPSTLTHVSLLSDLTTLINQAGIDHTHTETLSLTHSCTHTRFLSHTHTYAHTHSYTLSHSHTETHTHTQTDTQTDVFIGPLLVLGSGDANVSRVCVY